MMGSTSSMEPLMADTLAMAQDMEGYRAGLHTHKTFGCVMWEITYGGNEES